MNRKRDVHHRVNWGEYICDNIVLLLIFRVRISDESCLLVWMFTAYM